MSVSRREFLRDGAAVTLVVAGAGAYSGLTGSSAAAAAAPPPPLRPPGALPEDDFVSTCIRCMRCVDACPNQCLVSMPTEAPQGRAGTPTIHPRKAPCMLCSHDDGEFLKCTEACPSGALQRIRKDRREIIDKVAIGVARLDLDLCYSYNNWSCGACFRACPLAGTAMTIGRWERPIVHEDACVGCGCCERACIRYPHAIRVRGREA